MAAAAAAAAAGVGAGITVESAFDVLRERDTTGGPSPLVMLMLRCHFSDNWRRNVGVFDAFAGFGAAAAVAGGSEGLSAEI